MPDASASQLRNAAIRAAQVDAYRNLAERVNGLRIIGSSGISANGLRSDTVRTYVDGFVRGAQLTKTRELRDGSYEVTLELDLNLLPSRCSSTSCGASVLATTCDLPGCTAPSAYYVSND